MARGDGWPHGDRLTRCELLTSRAPLATQLRRGGRDTGARAARVRAVVRWAGSGIIRLRAHGGRDCCRFEGRSLFRPGTPPEWSYPVTGDLAADGIPASKACQVLGFSKQVSIRRFESHPFWTLSTSRYWVWAPPGRACERRRRWVGESPRV